jgi:hypothetical protein
LADRLGPNRIEGDSVSEKVGCGTTLLVSNELDHGDKNLRLRRLRNAPRPLNVLNSTENSLSFLETDDADDIVNARVTSTTVARIVGLTRQRIVHLEHVGYIKRGPDKLFGPVMGYISFRNDEDRRASKTASHNRLQDEKTAIARINRLRLDKQRFDVEESWAVFAEVFGAMKSEASREPRQVTAKVARPDVEPQARSGKRHWRKSTPSGPSMDGSQSSSMRVCHKPPPYNPRIRLDGAR